jgi:hypothetical protein
MARTRQKRKLKRRPGLMKFCRDTGTGYSHARRCIAGERQSKTLLAKFRAWQKSNPKNPTTHSHEKTIV